MSSIKNIFYNQNIRKANYEREGGKWGKGGIAKGTVEKSKNIYNNMKTKKCKIPAAFVHATSLPNDVRIVGLVMRPVFSFLVGRWILTD